MTPSPSVLAKLGSIAVHYDELLGPGGHYVDRTELKILLDDPELKDWLKQMDAMALIPKRRDGQ